MHNLIIKIFIVIVFSYATILSAERNDSNSISADETAVKAVVNKFLAAAGDYNTDAMPSLFTANANIGGASFRNGKWNTFAMTLDEFLALLKSNTSPNKYKEPVSKYTVFVEKGKLAFVKADATLIIEGKDNRVNFDYFTLLKQNDTWKIINGSYVSVPTDM